MKIKLFAILMALFITAQTTLAGPFNANAKTKRIPMLKGYFDLLPFHHLLLHSSRSSI